MSYSSEKFCLKWNDFEQNVITFYHEMRKQSDFTGVTLASEGDTQIEVHKFVFIACSPFFRSLLKKNHHSHPMIYMRGLRTKDLEAIIDLIYHGETNIHQEDLNGFLALAEELQLKGLAGSQENTLNLEIDVAVAVAVIHKTALARPRAVTILLRVSLLSL